MREVLLFSQFSLIVLDPKVTYLKGVQIVQFVEIHESVSDGLIKKKKGF